MEGVKEGGHHSLLHSDQRPRFLERHAAERSLYFLFLVLFLFLLPTLPFLCLKGRTALCSSH